MSPKRTSAISCGICDKSEVVWRGTSSARFTTQIHFAIAQQMRVRILKVPPASKLEGLELSSYDLRPDETRELKTPVAEVLIAWGYACRVINIPRPIKKKRIGRGK